MYKRQQEYQYTYSLCKKHEQVSDHQVVGRMTVHNTVMVRPMLPHVAAGTENTDYPSTFFAALIWKNGNTIT